MAESTIDLIVQVLQEYEKKSGKSCFIIANEMGIEPSNYYIYRDGRGNPTCRTLDKIFSVVRAEYPEILENLLVEILNDVQTEMNLAKSP